MSEARLPELLASLWVDLGNATLHADRGGSVAPVGLTAVRVRLRLGIRRRNEWRFVSSDVEEEATRLELELELVRSRPQAWPLLRGRGTQVVAFYRPGDARVLPGARDRVGWSEHGRDGRGSSSVVVPLSHASRPCLRLKEGDALRLLPPEAVPTTDRVRGRFDLANARYERQGLGVGDADTLFAGPCGRRDGLAGNYAVALVCPFLPTGQASPRETRWRRPLLKAERRWADVPFPLNFVTAGRDRELRGPPWVTNGRVSLTFRGGRPTTCARRGRPCSPAAALDELAALLLEWQRAAGGSAPGPALDDGFGVFTKAGAGEVGAVLEAACGAYEGALQDLPDGWDLVSFQAQVQTSDPARRGSQAADEDLPVAAELRAERSGGSAERAPADLDPAELPQGPPVGIGRVHLPPFLQLTPEGLRVQRGTEDAWITVAPGRPQTEEVANAVFERLYGWLDLDPLGA